jgi:hypothetical protein
MTTGGLEQRIQSIEDRMAIQDLVVRYCLSVDDNDYTALREMFTDKATMAGQVGGDPIVDRLASIRSGYGRTIHAPVAMTITLTNADHASGIVMTQAELAIQGRSVHTAIRYYDDYERGGDGRWRFAARTLKFVYALPVEEMSESLTGLNTIRWPGTEPVPADE